MHGKSAEAGQQQWWQRDKTPHQSSRTGVNAHHPGLSEWEDVAWKDHAGIIIRKMSKKQPGGAFPPTEDVNTVCTSMGEHLSSFLDFRE